MQSHLNEPFAATIQILGGGRDDELNVRFGDGESYRLLGLVRPRMLDRMELLIETSATGRAVRIVGDAPVTDLILDLVLVLEEGDSAQTRHYPVLIDFPTAASVAASEVPRRETRERPRAVRPGPRPAVKASGSSYGPVQRGETLSGIASLIGSEQPVGHWALVRALHELNPDAFIDGDMDRLKVGAVLQIPAMDGLAATTIRRSTPFAATPGAARRTTLRDDDQALIPPPVRDPGRQPADSRLEIIGTPNSAQILESMSAMLEQDDVELAAQGQEARRQLAFATAEIQTYRSENEQLRRQVRGLEARVVNLSRLIELRSAASASPPGDATSTDAAPAPEVAGREVTPTAGPDEVDGSLTLPGRVPTAADEWRARYAAWWPWALALLLLLALGVLLWLRSRQEEARRRERTADLVNRIRQAADRTSP